MLIARKIIPRIHFTPIPRFWRIFFMCLMQKTLLDGPAIKGFEERFASYLHMKHAILVPFGRVGMRLILQSLPLKRGDEVLMPNYTLAALADIIREEKLQPVFIDIHPHTFNLNPQHILQKITPKTRVILATHLFGLGCDIRKILHIARRKKIFVIEDCANALGAQIRGKPVGTFGDAAFFSFQMRKQINTITGGIVVTNNHILARRLRKKVQSLPKATKTIVYKKILRDYLLDRLLLHFPFYNVIAPLLHSSLKKKIRNLYQADYATKKEICRYTNFQAALGLAQIHIFEKQIQEHRERATFLAKLLAHEQNILLPTVPQGYTHIFYSYVIQTPYPAKILSDTLLKEGIDTAYDYDITQVCTDDPACRNTRDAQQYALEIPLGGLTTHTKIEKTAMAIKKSIASLRTIIRK